MDPTDIFTPIAPGPEPAAGGNRTQNIVAGVVAFGLPVVTMAILTVTDLSKQPIVAMLWLPVVFTALGLVMCVLARMRAWQIFTTSLACLWWCLVAGTALVVIDILIFPF